MIVSFALKHANIRKEKNYIQLVNPNYIFLSLTIILKFIAYNSLTFFRDLLIYYSILIHIKFISKLNLN